MNLRAKLIVLLAMLVGLSVTGYNIWSLSCGRCTIHTLLNPGLPGYVLLSLNLLMMTIFLILKRRRMARERKLQCHCGAQLVPDWQYCPDCGSARIE